MLKANAYGHGLTEMATILNDVECAFLAVDGYFEAVKIRNITRHRILVMGHILPENLGLVDPRQCSFVIQDIAGLHAFGETHRKIRVHLELNTGMNRLGLQLDEIVEYVRVLKKYPRLQLEGVMTHLADADNPASAAFTEEQVKLFDAAVTHIREAGFSPSFLHVAQTAGSAKVQSRYANATRLGIGLYGINPLDVSDRHHADFAGLKPVLKLTSTIVKAFEIQKGEKVSYNGIFTAPAAMRLGVLPIGYYEGLPRALSNKGMVFGGDVPLPILGRVCMNHTMIDISTSGLGTGSEVTVISNDVNHPNSVAQLSSEHGLFPYELLTGISSSLRRTVV